MNAFIRESNKIEGINREPTKQEEAEYERFMALDRITLADCNQFASVYQPNAKLRDKEGMNVRVGGYLPPKGGKGIHSKLCRILFAINRKEYNPFETHLAFEALHPYIDCNGRLGRMIWMWQMKEAPLGFLHTFYYQSLKHSRR